MRQLFAYAGLALAWLLPNHYYPWSSFWQEALAACAGALLVLSTLWAVRGPVRMSWLTLAVWALAAVPWLQWSAGLIHFGGDALIASLYLAGFGLALWLPQLQAQEPTQASGPGLDALLAGLAWTVLAGALGSLLLALHQWLGLEGLGIFLNDMPPNGRPFANLGQPNHLATLMLLGLVATGALYQRARLGAASAGLFAVLLCFGAVMTQSRTGWLELAALGLWLLAMRRRAALRVRPRAVFGVAAWFALLVSIWPALCNVLHLTPARGFKGVASAVGFGGADGDMRLRLWASMGEALARQPWGGYGWNQVAVAQARVAADRAASVVHIEHSHNIVLDLLVWNGIPLGGLLLLGLLAWGWARVRACREATTAWLLGGIGVLGVHGLLEFPLEYAYFLLPFGLMMGAVDALAPGGRASALRVPKAALVAAAAGVVLLLGGTVAEYVRVEERYRQLRFELAGYHAETDAIALSDIRLLTQLREFQRFARTQARRGMTPEELDWMRQVAERYGYPPVLFRYALAAALNGQPETAQRTLRLLCRIHAPAHCISGLDAWREMGAGGSYPELQQVTLPTRPAPPAPEPAR